MCCTGWDKKQFPETGVRTINNDSLIKTITINWHQFRSFTDGSLLRAPFNPLQPRELWKRYNGERPHSIFSLQLPQPYFTLRIRLVILKHIGWLQMDFLGGTRREKAYRGASCFLLLCLCLTHSNRPRPRCSKHRGRENPSRSQPCCKDVSKSTAYSSNKQHNTRRRHVGLTDS